MTMRRYWFQIKATNQIQSVWAVSFTEAKVKAARMYLPQWQGIEWLDLDRSDHSPNP
jgi:hypothetical protein